MDLSNRMRPSILVLFDTLSFLTANEMIIREILNIIVALMSLEKNVSLPLLFFKKVSFNNLTPVVQRVDNAIQRISIGKTNYAIHWIVLSTL